MDKKEPIFVIGKDGKKYELKMTPDELLDSIKNNDELCVEDTGVVIENIDKVDNINYFLISRGADIQVYSREKMQRMRLLRRCRSCDKEISKQDYFQRNNCPHCNRISSAKAMKQVYIAFDYNNHFLHRLDRINEYERGLDYELLAFYLSLNAGNIFDYADESLERAVKSNSEVYSAMYSDYEEISGFASSVIRDLESYDDDIEIYLYRKENDANGILNMWYLAPQLKRFHKVYEIIHNGEESLQEIISHKRLVSIEELEDMYIKFLNISKNGSYYRVIERGELKSYSRNYFEKTAIGLFGDNYPDGESGYIPFVLSEAIKKEHNGVIIAYEQALLILRDLLNNGVVETESNLGYGVHGCDYRDSEGKNVKLRLAKKRQYLFSHTEIQEKLLKTFKYGGLYNIYGLLDDNVVYHSVDVGKKIIGKENVVKYLEHISVKMSNAKGYERYNVGIAKINGEDVLYLRYPSGERDSVDFTLKDNKIDSITVNVIEDNPLLI